MKKFQISSLNAQTKVNGAGAPFAKGRSRTGGGGQRPSTLRPWGLPILSSHGLMILDSAVEDLA